MEARHERRWLEFLIAGLLVFTPQYASALALGTYELFDGQVFMTGLQGQQAVLLDTDTTGAAHNFNGTFTISRNPGNQYAMVNVLLDSTLGGVFSVREYDGLNASANLFRIGKEIDRPVIEGLTDTMLTIGGVAVKDVNGVEFSDHGRAVEWDLEALSSDTWSLYKGDEQFGIVNGGRGYFTSTNFHNRYDLRGALKGTEIGSLSFFIDDRGFAQFWAVSELGHRIDFRFKIRQGPGTVPPPGGEIPEPASLILLTSALIGVRGRRRAGRRSHAAA